MSSLSRDEVAHVAMLARIQLSDAELDKLAGQLEQIVGFVGQVNDIAADDIPPMSHPLPLTNVTRPDEVRPSLTQQEALSGAPASDLGRFEVPRILDED
ncbi:Asp-tRNA(Asn)/Glu-tRNA(Gln) amidotransferase subunit GatC [Yimella sp. NH-Cas1]|uniref:Asp-tRNA(Asn)/Glu-tRNA(Gln) amidotransferase subunit GatC n=1 Tax=Yimella sp. NH-Cas1 TaxID=2917726 RepID=UPI001EFAA005|nr:Asp-tRNA(Asn)/Glu-tRNA(Gln) amidotransferase subunit GatC [Yimella sp. NH-Cas1]MCG8655825.1 Asp-tRNA(Asn)/Glu-tRNA(Gln) amidotransferase subunit GatC [Yimella sp. NH-Cas1]